MKVAETGVVYLYRFAEGADPVRRFLDSYKRHPAGLAHDLHVILKGFPNRVAFDAARTLFSSLSINAIELDDTGYDIGSYFAAARVVTNQQLLFLNTFSEILADHWLSHFAGALALPDVGLVGATGSWQSASSGYEAAFFRALRRLRVRVAGSSAKANGSGAGSDEYGRLNVLKILRNVLRLGLYPARLYEFGRFPNPHIRSNAFMIRRDVLLSLRSVPFRKKIDAYKFESGRRSMTRQIIGRGFRPVVIDRRGRVYDASEWKSSLTFWIDVQGNLLVADNQTENYANGSSERRRLLKNHAWDSPWTWDI